jgi:hypothetical protein
VVLKTSPSPEKIRALADRAKHLTAISETPSYPVLKEIIEGRINAETRKFIGVPEVSPQHLDYTRGLLRGMQLVLDVIERGPKEFDQAMRMAQLEE